MNNGNKIGLSNIEMMVDGKYVPIAKGGVIEFEPLFDNLGDYYIPKKNTMECVVPLETIKKIYRRTPKGRKIYKLKLLNPFLKMIREELEKAIKGENNDKQ